MEGTLLNDSSPLTELNVDIVDPFRVECKNINLSG